MSPSGGTKALLYVEGHPFLCPKRVSKQGTFKPFQARTKISCNQLTTLSCLKRGSDGKAVLVQSNTILEDRGGGKKSCSRFRGQRIRSEPNDTRVQEQA